MNNNLSQIWEELKNLEENTHYIDADYRRQHFKKHVKQFEGDRQQEINAGLINLFDVMSEEEYDERGHQLSIKPVTSSETNSKDNIIGYIKKHYKSIKSPTVELFSFYLEQWLTILRENGWLNKHIDF